MRKILEQTVGRADESLGWPSRINGLTRVLWGILFLSLLYNPVQALSATLPGPYSVALAWNPNPDSCVAGYALYCGTASGSYSSRIDVGTNTTATVSGLTGGQTNYFAVTAYNVALVESAPAGEAMYIVPGIVLLTPASRPGDPVTLTFPVAPGHWYEIQASVDLKSWTTIQQTATATSNGWVQFLDTQAKAFQMRFYRLVLH